MTISRGICPVLILVASLLAPSLLSAAPPAPAEVTVRVKDLARFEGTSESAVLGYGLVVGLSGTGDSSRNRATVQSVSNMLREFGLQVPPESLNTRNVAAVLVTAELPAELRVGDRLDVNVSAIGDARSLAGGTLMLTPLLAADREVYAMAQGALSVGGFRFEQNGNVAQKNFPASAIVAQGAIAQRSSAGRGASTSVDLLLTQPDYTTAQRMAAAINQALPAAGAQALEAGRVRLGGAPRPGPEFVAFVAAIENVGVAPGARARVVVNERTGTVVAGGEVTISPVTFAQGDLRVSISERLRVSQPGGVLLGAGPDVRTAVVPDTRLRVREDTVDTVDLPRGASIAELVDALKAIKASPGEVVSILQGIKRAGALHAELVIQ
jgi:flagellar P-ring protein precursor FlgI